MKTFEYQEIDLDKNSWKMRFKESFKMLYQRPILSFVPFFIISYLLLFVFLPINTSLTIKITMFALVYIIPLLSFEFCTSNDYSKIPFKDSNYLFSEPIKKFYIYLTILIFTILFIIFAFSMFSAFLDFIFPLSNNNSENVSEPLLNNKDQHNESTLFWFHFFMKIIGVTFLAMIMLLGYMILLFVYLILHAVKLHDFSNSLKLLELALDGLEKNVKLFPFIGLFSFLQSWSIFPLADYPVITLILWTFFSSLGVILLYLISKEMSGGGSKLEKKESLLKNISTPQPKLANTEG